MSVKKEIAKVLREGGTYKVSNIARIDRWFQDALGNEVDGFTISFSFVVGCAGGKTYEIETRDIDEIMNIIPELHKKYLDMCCDEYKTHFLNGLDL